MKIYPLFPIVTTQEILKPGLTDEEKEFLNSFELKNNIFNKDSINCRVLDSKELVRLKDFLTQSINHYLNAVIKPATSCELYITQSWVNHTNKGERHHKHIHPNSIISGVFYVNVVSEKDRIIFFNNREQQLIKIDSASHDEMNSFAWWFPVQNNLLILFPSYLPHEVAEVETESTRVSLSFNTFIKGIIGSKHDKTELILGEEIGKSI